MDTTLKTKRHVHRYQAETKKRVVHSRQGFGTQKMKKMPVERYTYNLYIFGKVNISR